MELGEEYWDIFFDEVDTHLESLNKQITDLETSPDSTDVVHEIFRIVHTVKGMAATIGFNSIAKLCHKMEELFDFYRKNPRTVEKSTIEIEIKALDGLYKVVEYISENGEELPICTTLSDALSNELIDELQKLQSNGDRKTNKETKKSKKVSVKKSVPKQKEEIPDGQKLQVKVKYAEDCQMPAVRAYMTTQLLERSGSIISSIPDKEHFVDNDDILTHGLMASVNSKESSEFLKNNLLQISDVIDVQIEISDETENTTEESTGENATIISEPVRYQLSVDPAVLLEQINEKEKEDLFNSILKAYHIDLLLAEDVSNPEEQFINLINNLNDYIGHVIKSVPSLKELDILRQTLPSPQTITSIVNSVTTGEDHSKDKTRRRIQFILLINGTHKSVLDFLSDACELNKVEVKEIKIPTSTPTNNTENRSEDTKEETKNDQPKPTENNAPKVKHSDVKTTFVRVNLATLESLMNAVGELVINHNKIKLTLGENPSSEIMTTTQYLHQVTTKIQQLVMSIRMVPVNQVFSRFPRFIRDVSRELQKEVHLELEGESTEIDRIMVDELNEIFIHLVRNAIDHGLETAEERENLGKPKSGLIKMQAYAQGNNVFVTISDDGKGISPEKVKKKAIEKGILEKEQADALSKEEALNLIFATGFSTADKVSDLSGRGVGMDIVKSKVSSLGGQIVLNSNQGEGTSIRLSIPSTISIIQALLINNKSGLYAIPLSEIKEIVTIKIKEHVYTVGSCDIIVLHNQTVPIINLEKYLSPEDENNSISSLLDDCLVVVVASEGNQYGIIVESLVGQQEIVIKPISNRANLEGFVNGATVFGDGRVAMILNIENIIKIYLNDNPLDEIPESYYEPLLDDNKKQEKKEKINRVSKKQRKPLLDS